MLGNLNLSPPLPPLPPHPPPHDSELPPPLEALLAAIKSRVLLALFTRPPLSTNPDRLEALGPSTELLVLLVEVPVCECRWPSFFLLRCTVEKGFSALAPPLLYAGLLFSLGGASHDAAETAAPPRPPSSLCGAVRDEGVTAPVASPSLLAASDRWCKALDGVDEDTSAATLSSIMWDGGGPSFSLSAACLLATSSCEPCLLQSSLTSSSPLTVAPAVAFSVRPFRPRFRFSQHKNLCCTVETAEIDPEQDLCMDRGLA